MRICGLQKTTLLDYPGKVACTLFLGGCNFRCPFCQNAELLDGKGGEDISEEELFSFLSRRQGILDGVCVTGGEPLLSDVRPLLSRIKELGFSVKLDTNGSFPARLKALVADGLSPLCVTFGRGVTFFTISLLLWLWEKERRSRAAWRIFLTRESFFAFVAGVSSLGFGAFFFSSALASVPPAVASTIGGANPIAATIAAMFIYKEKPTPHQWAGIFLAVLGSALVTL